MPPNPRAAWPIYSGRYVWRHQITGRQETPTPAFPAPTLNVELWDLIDTQPEAPAPC